MNKQAPKYGRFSFPSIEEFISRLRQIANTFFVSAEFSAYLITHEKGSFYGLDGEELESRYNHFKGLVKSLSASCSDIEGRSVSMNIRFGKNSEMGEGQYVIVSNNPFESRQIMQMIHGEWQEPTENEKKREEQWRLRQEQEEEEEKNKEEEKKAESRKRTQTKLLPIVSLSDAFHFDENISVEVLNSLLEELANNYMGGEPFSIRMITKDGDLFYNVGYSGLEQIFSRRRNILLKLLMDGTNDEGEKIQISLAFGPGSRTQNAELEVHAREAREIKNLVRDALEQSMTEIQAAQTTMVHEMFSFNQAGFSLEEVIRLLKRISSRYLDGEKISAFLSNTDGDTFPAIPLDKLLDIFQDSKIKASFLLFGANQSLLGQTFSLMFQFQSRDFKPYGSLSMMWGSEENHQQIRREIWDTLRLSSYIPREHRSMPPEVGALHTMLVRPIFSRRNLSQEKHSTLIIMPLEAYWSESLWVYIKDTLQAVGIDSFRSEALFSENKLEDTWSYINKAEMIIADLTYKHPDVFYKVGIAHTLGKRILLISQHTRDIPQDFKKYPHMIYDNNIYGLQRLADRLVSWVKTS